MCNLSTDKYSFISLLLDIYNNVDIILKTIKKSLKLTVQTINIFYLQRRYYVRGINRQLFNTSEWLSLYIIVGCLAEINWQLFNTSEWLSLCIIVGCLAEINRQLFNTSEWLSLCIIVGCLAGMNCLLFSISSTISTILRKLVSIQFPHDLILRSPMLLTSSIVYVLLWRCGEFFSVYCDSWLIRLLSFNVYIYALKKTVT